MPFKFLCIQISKSIALRYHVITSISLKFESNSTEIIDKIYSIEIDDTASQRSIRLKLTAVKEDLGKDKPPMS